MLEQVDYWQEYLALVNMILFCTGVPGHYPVSETTSSLTLTFWYTLQVRSGLILTLFRACEEFLSKFTSSDSSPTSHSPKIMYVSIGNSQLSIGVCARVNRCLSYRAPVCSRRRV